MKDIKPDEKNVNPFNLKVQWNNFKNNPFRMTGKALCYIVFGIVALFIILCDEFDSKASIKQNPDLLLLVKIDNSWLEIYKNGTTSLSPKQKP